MYDIAQICINGHVINSRAQSNPERNQKFCDICGEQTITECPQCKNPIRGNYHVPGVLAIGFEYIPPKFCHNCGKPYTWTEMKLRTAQELADEVENLTPAERDILKLSLDELVRDTPDVQIASLRFKKLMTKAGKDVANAFRDILVDVASETAKKMLWPEL